MVRERRRNKFVWLCGIIAFLTFAGFTGYEIAVYFKLDPGIERIDFTSEAKRAAVKLFFDQIALVGNLSLASLGVLWAFVLQKGHPIEIRRVRDYVLFGSTNLFFLASLYCHLIGTKLLTERIFSYDAADIRAPIVQFWSTAQLINFGLGVLFVFVTVFCCRRKEPD